MPPGRSRTPAADAVSSAADTAGIGLTFLPTLYQSSDFGGRPLRPEQGRFFLDTDEFLRAIERRSGFSRAWRDLETLGAHGSLAPQRLEAAGGVLLDQAARSDTSSCASVPIGGAQTLPEHT